VAAVNAGYQQQRTWGDGMRDEQKQQDEADTGLSAGQTICSSTQYHPCKMFMHRTVQQAAFAAWLRFQA
jgi:hypothetical protein